MISHKHKVLFVHIPKAAGSSVETVFLDDLNLKFNDALSILLGINTNSCGTRLLQHMTITEYIDYHFISHELFEQYFKFSIVRNPCDRIFSIYRYRNFDSVMSFDSFVKNKLHKLLQNKKENFFYKPQYEFLYDNDTLLVDYIGRLENFDEDMDFILNKIGLPKKAPHVNKTVNKRNRMILTSKGLGKLIIEDIRFIASGKLEFFKNQPNFLSRESKNIINSIYKIDFEKFNYDIL